MWFVRMLARFVIEKLTWNGLASIKALGSRLCLSSHLKRNVPISSSHCWLSSRLILHRLVGADAKNFRLCCSVLFHSP